MCIYFQGLKVVEADTPAVIDRAPIFAPEVEQIVPYADHVRCDVV
jgi:hypothetical protein